MEITISISDEHADVIRECDFDGHAAPSDVTDLRERIEALLWSLCQQALVDEAYSQLMLYKRLRGIRPDE